MSVLIPTLDEELNLPDCLASVEWADEVFVVDSFSHDRTLEIARAHGANVVQHAFEGYSRQKNWALDNLPFQNEWVLIVDADERVTAELRGEIERVVNSRGAGCDGYYLNRRFIFLGAWIRHAGWYPSWNLRLFRHRLGRYDNREVHEHLVLDGRVGYLQADLLHDDQRGLEAFVARHNRYSTLEAAARWKAESKARGPCPPAGQLAGLARPAQALLARARLAQPARQTRRAVHLYVPVAPRLPGRSRRAWRCACSTPSRSSWSA